MGCPEGARAECGSDETEGLADHLRGRRRPQELTAAARRAARAAAQLLRALQGQLAVGKARADGLDLAGVLAVARRQGDPAGHQHAGEIAHGHEGQHHGGQALVAGGDAHHAPARGQRADQAAKDDGGVVAVGEAVHHPGRPLRAPVAGIGDEGREGQALEPRQLLGRGLHQEADFPVAGVIAEGDRAAVGAPHAALGAQQKELRAQQLPRIPAHARVLRQPEDVAARLLAQHLGGEGQAPGRPGAGRLDRPGLGARLDDGVEGEGHGSSFLSEAPGHGHPRGGRNAYPRASRMAWAMRRAPS